MGEVWKARDPRVGRDVAIKISRSEYSERFTREARAIGALNHSNVCHLYDVGPNYIVLEYVGGATLQESTAQGPLPLDDALPVIHQLIDGIEAAHEKNIIHRDLKPANVKITPEGTVKILDFGLAKAAEAPRDEASPENSPTLTMGATVAGTILGTAAYMSPEQAKGKQADRRSDIWSFGAVVYELLTGKKPFAGETTVEILGAVMNQEPDWTPVPERMRRLLQRCLQKDRRNRLGAIGDARWMIEEAAAASAPATATVAARGRVLPWMIGAAVLAVVAAAVSVTHFRETPPEERVLRFSVSLPANIGYLSLSPDASRLAVVSFGSGTAQLSIRPLNSLQFQRLPSADRARDPFWSPDSRFIGFFADGKLKTVPATGGPAQTLCDDTGLGAGGTWNRDGEILFASQNGPLRRVKATGGECVAVGQADPNTRNAFPEFLPDGKHFLYFHNVRGDESTRGTYVAALGDPNGRRILSDNSSAIYAPPRRQERHGHLLFLREGNLMAQSFDVAALATLGDPFLVATQASVSASLSAPAVSIAPDGTLVYLANRSPETQLTWLDRAGKDLGKVGAPADRRGVSLSPDGNAVAYGIRNQGPRVYDLARGSETRFPELQANIMWSADSGRIILSQPGQDLLVKSTNGSGPMESLLKTTENVIASDWSRDGRYLIYTHTDAKANSDIWYLPNPGKPDSKPVKFLGSDAIESQGQLSPDGRWLAYTSNETGAFEVYVRPFPSGPGQWKISTGGAREPRWSRDGRELFLLKPGVPDEMLSASIQPDGRGDLKAGVPQKLFDFQTSGFVPQANAFSYSPHPDGKRFLVKVNTDTTTPAINIITNWQRAVTQSGER